MVELRHWTAAGRSTFTNFTLEHLRKLNQHTLMERENVEHTDDQ